MVTKIKIKNFKSIEELEFEPGRVNVLIGENGCGKSNILEAITFGASAADNKLGNEFLFTRGIRVSEPEFMVSAFTKSKASDPIEISIVTSDFGYKFNLIYQKKNLQGWSDLDLMKADEFFAPFRKTNTTPKYKNGEKKIIDNVYMRYSENSYISRFLIYAPYYNALRTFEKEGQIQPLGIKGEGLFKLIKNFNTHQLRITKDKLKVFDWFADYKIQKGEFDIEKGITIMDKYINSKTELFDQRSANEGFLFLLFYYSLLLSEKTPSFFAIDNIDGTLNPKLCSRLMSDIAELANNERKQVIVTTHNPSMLDGLDLNDDQQRLFVVYRNKFGHTKLQRVLKPKFGKSEPVKLSEAFMNGYIGGLPNNF